MNNLAVKFDSVTFSYGDNKDGAFCAQVLENASFHIHFGEFVAMVGPNGSGKTTVLKLLLGLIKPASGKIEVLAGNPAYVPQSLTAENKFPITVRDVVRMGLLSPLGSYRQENDSIAEAMQKAGIEDLAMRQYSTLSGGQKRRALVARALAARPQLLVLDEPTANMDSESEERLYKALSLYKGKTTILIVTHDTEFVTSLTDRVLCLGEGYKVIQHRTEESENAHRVGKKARVLHSENISCCE